MECTNVWHFARFSFWRDGGQILFYYLTLIANIYKDNNEEFTKKNKERKKLLFQQLMIVDCTEK